MANCAAKFKSGNDTYYCELTDGHAIAHFNPRFGEWPVAASASVSSPERKPVTLLEARAIALAGLERAERLRDEGFRAHAASFGALQAVSMLTDLEGEVDDYAEVVHAVERLRAEVASLSSSLIEARADTEMLRAKVECGAPCLGDGFDPSSHDDGSVCPDCILRVQGATTRAEDTTPE